MLSIGKTHNSESQIQFTSKKRRKNHIYHFNGSLCEIDFNINKNNKICCFNNYFNKLNKIKSLYIQTKLNCPTKNNNLSVIENYSPVYLLIV